MKHQKRWKWMIGFGILGTIVGISDFNFKIIIFYALWTIISFICFKNNVIIFPDKEKNKTNKNYNTNNLQKTEKINNVETLVSYGRLPTDEEKRKERNKMTKKLREEILLRDNYTCKKCGLSRYVEPNLNLHVDHIIPIAKGGKTVKENLQTLCWKCNLSKGDKLEDD